MSFRLRRLIAANLFVSLVFSAFGAFSVTPAFAASVTSLSDNMSRNKASTLSDHTVQFITPTGVTSFSQTITLNFNSFTTVTAVTASDVDIAVSAAGTCASFTDRTVAASAGADIWGVGVSGTTVTLTAPASGTIGTSGVPAGRCVQIEIGANATSGATGTTRITNPAAGTATISVAGTFGDTGTIAEAIIADDQVAITATVDPTLTFTLGANSLQFGTLTTANARYATTSGGSASVTSAHTITAATNATSGYTVYVLGATLTSGANTITALGSSTASSPGSSQFGINVSASGGSGTATAPYSTASQYAYTATASTQAQIASSTASSATTTYTLTYLANITAQQPAGSYATTLTYTATGTF